MLPVSPVLPGSNFEEIKVAEHQPEYQTLPVVAFENGTIVSRWEMDEAERNIVRATGELYICLLTFGAPQPPTLFQVDSPLAGETPEENLKAKTCYFGTGLPIIADDGQCVWLVLELTNEDRETVAREGNVYFFMKTGGRPVTPSLIQVENPCAGDDVEFIIGVRATDKAAEMAARHKIEPAEYLCCVCNHKTIVSKQIVPRIEKNGIKVICRVCSEGSPLNICVVPETVDELKRVIEADNFTEN